MVPWCRFSIPPSPTGGPRMHLLQPPGSGMGWAGCVHGAEAKSEPKGEGAHLQKEGEKGEAAASFLFYLCR